MLIRMLAVLAVLCFVSGMYAQDKYEASFDVPAERFVTSGQSGFYVLEAGRVMEYAGEERGKPAKLVVTVTEKTKTIAGVETRVVEMNRSADGAPQENRRLFLAMDRSNKDVYCFGKEVDRFQAGEIKDHDGTWHAGEGEARPALWVPDRAKGGRKFQRELAPAVAMERAEIMPNLTRKRVPAGAFDRCAVLKLTTPLSTEPARYEVFAPGVGMIADGGLELLKNPAPVAKKAKGAGDAPEPIIPIEEARAALDMVGADPMAEAIWAEAINDPNLSDHQRQDLIEDLNENGFADPGNVSMDELPLVLSRLALIEQLAPDAMDQTNADAFEEAYKDLSNIAAKLAAQ